MTLTEGQKSEMRRLHGPGCGASRLARMFHAPYWMVRSVVDGRQRAAMLMSATLRRMRVRLAAAVPTDRARLLELRALQQMSPDQESEWFVLGFRVFGRAFGRVPHGDWCDRVVGEALVAAEPPQ